MLGTTFFFLELASSDGRLLKIDEVTINKEKMDFARLLIATSDLKELNDVVNFWIDGRVYPIRVIEDVEFGFAVDACLSEFEADNKSQCSAPDCFQEEEPLVDALVQQLKDDWIKNSNEVPGDVNELDISRSIHGEVKHSETNDDSCSNSIKNPTAGVQGEGGVNNGEVAHKSLSKRRKLAPSLQGLKKIARLSQSDRMTWIRSLKKSKHSKRNKVKGKSSKATSSKNNVVSLTAGLGPSANSKDWKNWVSLHGDAKDVEYDVLDVGESIGIRCKNSFQALDRRGVRVGSGVGGEARLEGAV